jgi:predicted GH43/DUF377 family glycosyl hydrolase
MVDRNLCRKVLIGGGSITPLIIPSSETGGTGLMNPSIFILDDRILVNVRHVNYTLYHSEGNQQYQNRFGPLVYINPENDVKLKTINFICELSDNFKIVNNYKVDTSKLDVDPMWDFHGLEDARLFEWNKHLYLCGVRRDTTPTGIGRMELSEIKIEKGTVKEVGRYRISPPDNADTYCEKNWVPVLNMPYHFLKWTNPTEVIKVDLKTKTSETVHLSDKINTDVPDFRGGSQVFNWEGYRVAVMHQVNLFSNRLGQKDSTYMHRFVVWDKDWSIVKFSEPFSFMTGEIEFCCGAAIYKNDLLITFGFQDNAAYLLKVPGKMISSLLL